MVKLIMGLKGSGKTKTLVELVKQAVEVESGSVVCIERNNALTYDIPYTVRLINGGDYGINTFELMKGFLCGLHAGNFDITHVFVDNLYKTINKPVDAGMEEVDAFLAWAARFAEVNGMNLTFSISEDVANASEEMKKYL